MANKRKEMLQKHIDDKCKAFAVWLGLYGWKLNGTSATESWFIHIGTNSVEKLNTLYKLFSDDYVRKMQNKEDEDFLARPVSGNANGSQENIGDSDNNSSLDTDADR